MNTCQAVDDQTAGALPGVMQGPHGEAAPLLRLALARGPVRIAIVHPCDSPSLAAMSAASRAGLIDPVIVGPRGRVQALASAAGFDLAGVEIEDVPHSHAAAARAVELAARGHVSGLRMCTCGAHPTSDRGRREGRTVVARVSGGVGELRNHHRVFYRRRYQRWRQNVGDGPGSADHREQHWHAGLRTRCSA